MGSTPINISASRGAAVLGMSEWSTPLKVWMEIMEAKEPGFCAGRGYKLEPFEESAAMRWGLAFEDEICKIAADKHNDGITWHEKEYEKSGFDYITCHIDGYYKNLKALHEGKTTNSRTYYSKWGEPGTDHIPRSYQIQVQHQMLCSGINDCIVSVLVFPKMVDEWEEMGWRPDHSNGGESSHDLNKLDEDGIHMDYSEEIGTLDWAQALDQMGFFHQYPVKANPDLQALMLEKYTAFWNANVLGKVPPEPRNYDDIKRLAIEPKGTIVATEEEWRWSKEYKDITDEMRAANKRKDELKTLLIKNMNSRAEAPIDDDSVEKFILVGPDGEKLNTFNGKTFR